MKHSGWKRAFGDEVESEEPDAVTIRPDIGREQFAQVAVGIPARDAGLSQGRRDVVLAWGSLGGDE